MSGLVVFAKTSKALSRLNEMFKNSEVKKTYWAVVKNLPREEEGELVPSIRVCVSNFCTIISINSLAICSF